MRWICLNPVILFIVVPSWRALPLYPPVSLHSRHVVPPLYPSVVPLPLFTYVSIYVPMYPYTPVSLCHCVADYHWLLSGLRLRIRLRRRLRLCTNREQTRVSNVRPQPRNAVTESSTCKCTYGCTCNHTYHSTNVHICTLMYMFVHWIDDLASNVQTCTLVILTAIRWQRHCVRKSYNVVYTVICL